MGRFDNIDLGYDKAMVRMIKAQQEQAKAMAMEWMTEWPQELLQAMAKQNGPLAEIAKAKLGQ